MQKSPFHIKPLLLSALSIRSGFSGCLKDPVKPSQMKQRALDLSERSRSGIRSGHDHDIQTTIEYLFLQPVAFTNQPCNMGPYNAVPNLFAHGYPDPVPAAVIFQHIHDKQTVGIGSALSVNSTEILILFQAL